MEGFCNDKYDRRKLFYHPRAIADLLESGDTWPVTVNTGFTTYCNHSCAWCSTAYSTRALPSMKGRDKLLIDPDVWKRNVKILAERGTKSLIIAGQGEPLLHPKALELLDFVSSTTLKYMIFSNGEFLTDKYHDSFFKSCLAVRLSVDAATSAMHEKWHAAKNSNGRGTANFQRVVDNIQDLVNKKRARGLLYPHIGCQMICSKLTEDDFEDFANLFKSIGVDYVVYKSLQGNPSNQNITLNSRDLHDSQEQRQQQALQMIEKLRTIKDKYQDDKFEVHVKFDQIENAYIKEFNGEEHYSTCKAHPLTPMVEPDGKVYLCIDHGGNNDFVIGNIYDNDIDDIWVSERRQEVVRSIDLKKKCPAGCFLHEANILLHELDNPKPHLHHQLV